MDLCRIVGLEPSGIGSGAEEVHVRLPAGSGMWGLLHYAATVLIFGGANKKTVQLAMGHTTPTVTRNTYAGYRPGAVDRTRSLVDFALSCTQTVPKPTAGPETAGRNG